MIPTNLTAYRINSALAHHQRRQRHRIMVIYIALGVLSAGVGFITGQVLAFLSGH
jgi:hypothetical protein